MLTCNVVKDLLPNYIEGLVSEETAGEIEAHLAECAECRNMYEQMTTPLAAEDEQEEAEVDFLKKVRRISKRRIFQYSAISVLIAAIVVSFVSFRINSPESSVDGEVYFATITAGYLGHTDRIALAVSRPHSGHTGTLDIALHAPNGHEPLLAAWDFLDGSIIITPQETLTYPDKPDISFSISHLNILKELIQEDFQIILRLADRDIVFTLETIVAMPYE